MAIGHLGGCDARWDDGGCDSSRIAEVVKLLVAVDWKLLNLLGRDVLDVGVVAAGDASKTESEEIRWSPMEDKWKGRSAMEKNGMRAK
ncbi:hypothetical protein LXL04_038795 [Taraxacum kok-saghyz]